MAGACILASLHLMTPGFHDIASLDCELHRLRLLEAADAAPWDELATACVSPTTLLSADACPRVSTSFAGVDAYPLYQESVGTAFFARQTDVQTSECERWFVQPAVDGQCTCSDIAALKTIGSPVRTKMLQIHADRTEAANVVRKSRTVSITVVERAIAAVLTMSPAACTHARSVYDEAYLMTAPVDAVTKPA